MDSFDKVATNVFKVENLSRVPYRVYSPGTRRSNPNSAPGDGRLAQQGNTLRRAEAYARERNGCVYVDFRYAEIWVFDVQLAEALQTPDVTKSAFADGKTPSKTPDTPKSSHKDAAYPLHFPTEWGLRRSAEGTFSASSLTPPVPVQPRTPIIDLTQDDVKPENLADKITPDVEWAMFVCAILSSVGYNMTREGRFLPLSMRDFVSLPCPRKPADELQKDQFSRFLPKVECIGKITCSLSVHLATSGVLCITPSTKAVRSLGRLVDLSADESSLEGRDVWIAPWGQVARLVARTVEGSKNSNFASWKGLVSEYLQAKGLDVSSAEVGLDGSWSRVIIVRELAEGPVEEQILWPTALCFIKEREGDGLLSKPSMQTVGYVTYSDDFTKPLQPSDKDMEWLSTVFGSRTDWRHPGFAPLSESLINEYVADNGLSWFTTEKDGPPDSIGFMLTWAEGKADRDGNIRTYEEEEKKRKAMLEAAALKAAEGGQGDRQGMPMKGTGVYPTPPDAPGFPPIANAGSVAEGSRDGMDIDGGEWLGDPATKPGGTGGFDELLEEGDAFITDKDFDDFFDDPTGMDLEIQNTGGFQMIDHMDLSDQPEPEPSKEKTPERPVDVDINFELNTFQQPDDNTSAMQPESSAQDVELFGEDPDLPDTHIQTPPLSPHRAMALLIPEYSGGEPNPHPTPPTTSNAEGMAYPKKAKEDAEKSKASLYGAVSFLPNVEKADSKYKPGGRFYVPPDQELEDLEKCTKVITLGSPTERKRRPSIARSKSALGSVKRKSASAPLTVMSDPGEMDHNMDQYSEYSEATESESDASDETLESEDVISPKSAVYAGTSLKRKRSLNDDGDLDSGEDQLRLTSNDASLKILPPPSELLPCDPSDASLVDVFDTLSLKKDACSDINERDMFTITAVIADQIMGSFFMPLRQEWATGSSINELTNSISRRKIADETIIHECITGIFSTATKCDLDTLTLIPDAVQELPRLGRTTIRPVVPPGRRPTMRATPGALSNPSSPMTEAPPGPLHSGQVLKIAPPHVHVHRGENALELLPPALKFWDTFGLNPCSGPKNVISLCIFPSGLAMREAVDGFLDRIGSMYDACRLGMHVRANIEGISGGLVEWALPPGHRKDTESYMVRLMHLCGEVGLLLSRIADEKQNIVIYVVNPFLHPSALVDISKAFVKLKRSYHQCMKTYKLESQLNNTILQVVPVDFVAEYDSVKVIDNDDAMKMAMEVYNRCSVPGVLELTWQSVCTKHYPPFRLTKPPPSSIEFRLSSEPSPDLLYENSMMHVAYQQSLDERWITAAWSDNWGEVRVTKAFCLGRRNGQMVRSLEDIYREIWKFTTDVVKVRNVQWKTIITKVGALDQEDIETWTKIAAPSSYRSLPFTLISANLSPSLSLVPPSSTVNFSDFRMAFHSVTPVSTPGPSQSVMSPVDSGAPATPVGEGPAELDQSSVLIDHNDESWVVLLSHRTPISPSLTDFGPIYATGYLVSRGSSDITDRLTVIQANVVLFPPPWVPNAESTLLKEIIIAWRGLCILDWGNGRGVPWHLAAVERGARGLEEIL